MAEYLRRSCGFRLPALLLLAGMLAGQAALVHTDADDPACALLPFSDQTDRRVGAAGAAGHEHCYTCHWVRSLRSPLVAVGRLVTPPRQRFELPGTFVASAGRESCARLTGRSPPA